MATTKKQTKKTPEKHMFMQKVWIYIQKCLSLRKHWTTAFEKYKLSFFHEHYYHNNYYWIPISLVHVTLNRFAFVSYNEIGLHPEKCNNAHNVKRIQKQNTKSLIPLFWSVWLYAQTEHIKWIWFYTGPRQKNMNVFFFSS